MKTIWRIVAVAAITLLVSACSDGELKFGGQTDIVPPEILIDFSANPAQINEGGSTTLKWDVKNASHIQISGKAIAAEEAGFSYNFETEEMAGEVTVDGIPADIDLTLTATNTIDLPVTPEEGEQAEEEQGEDKPEGSVSEDEEADKEEEKEETAEDEAEDTEAAEDAEGENQAAYTFKKMGQIPVGVTPEVQPEIVPTTISASKTIRVTVIPASEMIAEITAEQTNLSTGDSTVIRWNYSDDLTASVTSSTNQVIEPQADCALETGTPGVISECATVSPQTTTTYVLTALDADGNEYTDSVMVNVEEVDLQAEIRVNGSDGFYSISNPMESFQVTWNVEPENALVTITADPEAQCDKEFPVEIESASGSATCTVSPNSVQTNFSIIATLGDQQDTENVIVKIVASSGGAPLQVISEPWAVESEEIEVEVKADNLAQITAIESIKVCGQTIDKQDLAEGTKQSCRVTNKGAPIEVKYAAMEEPKTQQAVESIIPLANQQFFHNAGNQQALPVTKVLIDKNNINKAYYGVQRPEFGEISVYKVTNFADSLEFAIDIEESIKHAFDLQDLWQNNTFFDEREYPVGAIAIREGNDSQMFAASTGIIMYTNDGGEDWDRLDAIMYYRDDNYTGETCAGKSQANLPPAMDYGRDEDVVAIGQICDMIAKADGRFIVAFDRGVAITENVDAFIESWEDAPWYGIPVNGKTAEEWGYVPTTVAHDLEEVGNKVYVATNQGVYVNDGSSRTWDAFNGGEINNNTKVYSLAYNERTDELYAGVEHGVYVTSVDNANWTKNSDMQGLVLSLAVDPYASAEKPVVIAGTTTGMAITRNGGDSWSHLTSPAVEDLAEVRSVALAAKQEGEVISYKLSAAGSGYVTGGVTVGSYTNIPLPEDNDMDEEDENIEEPDTEDNPPADDNSDDDEIEDETEDNTPGDTNEDDDEEEPFEEEEDNPTTG